MNSKSPLKMFVGAFIIALVMYVIAYNGLEYLRTRNGPWETTFVQSGDEPPTLIINQTGLGIANVKLQFPRQHSSPTNETLRFSQPKTWPFNVPFGTCIFEDTTFQPGTIVFNLYGHEIQLIRKALSIDRKEHAWESGLTIPITNGAVLIKPSPANVQTNAAN